MSKAAIYFHFEDSSPIDIGSEEKVGNWVLSAISKEDKVTGTINIIFCSDEYLLGLNKKHLDHDEYTDVITFDQSSDGNTSGDIYVSIDRVKDNSKSLNIKLLDEVHRVIIHGTLHLLGYSDKAPEDKEEMTSKEDYYLSLRAF
jgi:probable rRNA maturation factor